ncbi:hypothetical protein BBJ28_00001327 [Nothophytophthora sp. Chile5]|nr:hypothetical protein BBJ28_00001327 [Nothophytophthora sp. Chile5]
MPFVYDVPLEPPVGNVTLAAEVSKAVPLSWMPGANACFGDMLKDGEAWAHCPRSFLRRQAKALLDGFGIQVTVGFELEFQLLHRNTYGDLTPVDSSLYCEARSLYDPTTWSLLQRIVSSLENDLGTPVHQFHAESASGQFEISIGPFNTKADGDPVDSLVEAVDKLVLARQCVYGLAAQVGWQATFVPKLHEREAGNAAHIHLGLLSAADGTNLFTNSSVQQPEAEQFVAGILTELPGMCFLLAPTCNSYERLQPQCWAGAFQCYGYENKEAPIRLISRSNGAAGLSGVDHFEVKTGDATANPYVSLGALLAGGMEGLRNHSKLPPPFTEDPSTLPEPQRPAGLPRSLEEAMKAFGESAEVWRRILAPTYFELLLALRNAEWEHDAEQPSRKDRLRQLVMRF